MAQTSITSTAQMKAVSNNLQNMLGNYVNQVNRLLEIGNEVDGMWDGEASDKFKSIIAKDVEKFEGLRELIKAYITALDDIVRNYETNERKATDILTTKSV